MKNKATVLVINSRFPEINQLAGALAEESLLTRYIRPYANLGRIWERALAKLPLFGRAYVRTFGRRVMPVPLSAVHVKEVGIGLDFAMAIHTRLRFSSSWFRNLRKNLINRTEDVVAETGADALFEERMVVASWYCALPAFKKASQHGIIRVLNYPLAHHAFTRRYLQEEADLEPAFRATLNSHDSPKWQVDRLDKEIELANHILVGSSFAKETFLMEGVPAEKIEVIPYGADTSLFKPAECKIINHNQFNVIFVGQLSQRKGLSYLLRAYERIHGPGTSLTLVGQLQDDGESLMPWRYLYRHIPHVPRVELARLYQQADVFVFPTLVEGMGLVVVEAMASGLPVITTPNGPGDIVRDGLEGFLVPPRDVDALANRLQRLKDDPVLRNIMAENAHSRSQYFTWANYRETVLMRISSWLEE